MAWEAGVQMEEVRTTGTVAANLCQNSGNCVFDITTISPFGRVGLILLRSFDLQLRAGADLVVPVSVNSNVIAYQPFVPLSFLSAGVSVRFGHNPKYRFPIAFDYSTYVGSNNVVTLSRTMISIGYTWR